MNSNGKTEDRDLNCRMIAPSLAAALKQDIRDTKSRYPMKVSQVGLGQRPPSTHPSPNVLRFPFTPCTHSQLKNMVPYAKRKRLNGNDKDM